MSLRTKTYLCLVLGGVMAAAALAVGPISAQPGAPDVRVVALAGTGSPQTGDYIGVGDAFGGPEFVGEQDSDEGPDAFDGVIDRSLTTGVGKAASAHSGKKAKSSPSLNTSFEGLNHFQQRYARGGNQFSVEPPDQALCVGNGYELEAVNDVLNIFDASGSAVLPDHDVV